MKEKWKVKTTQEQLWGREEIYGIILNEIKLRSRNGNYIKENKDTVTEYELSPLSVFSKYNKFMVNFDKPFWHAVDRTPMSENRYAYGNETMTRSRDAKKLPTAFRATVAESFFQEVNFRIVNYAR